MFCVTLTPKIKGQITYYLVNASPKPLYRSHDVEGSGQQIM